jgi:transcriptional regulator with XRE-family HTH domain
MSDSERYAIGQRVLDLLRAQGVPQEVFAKKLGMSQSSVSAWGKTSGPQIGMIAQIAELLGTTLDYLITGKGPLNPPPGKSTQQRLAAEDQDQILPLGMWADFHDFTRAKPNPDKKPVIFLSHSSHDKVLADALREFVVGLGICNNQLIYTSHKDHRVPLGYDIYKYLKDGIRHNSMMITLCSKSYFESPTCLCEVGAAWAVGCELINVYMAESVLENATLKKTPIDTGKMGIVLSNTEQCQSRMKELAEKMLSLVGAPTDENTITSAVDKFMPIIKTLRQAADEADRVTVEKGRALASSA